VKLSPSCSVSCRFRAGQAGCCDVRPSHVGPSPNGTVRPQPSRPSMRRRAPCLARLSAQLRARGAARPESRGRRAEAGDRRPTACCCGHAAEVRWTGGGRKTERGWMDAARRTPHAAPLPSTAPSRNVSTGAPRACRRLVHGCWRLVRAQDERCGDRLMGQKCERRADGATGGEQGTMEPSRRRLADATLLARSARRPKQEKRPQGQTAPCVMAGRAKAYASPAAARSLRGPGSCMHCTPVLHPLALHLPHPSPLQTSDAARGPILRPAYIPAVEHR